MPLALRLVTRKWSNDKNLGIKDIQKYVNCYSDKKTALSKHKLILFGDFHVFTEDTCGFSIIMWTTQVDQRSINDLSQHHGEGKSAKRNSWLRICVIDGLWLKYSEMINQIRDKMQVLCSRLKKHVLLILDSSPKFYRLK